MVLTGGAAGGPAGRRTGPDPADLLGRLLHCTAHAVDADEVLRATAALLVGPVADRSVADRSVADWVVADRLVEPDLVVRVAALGRSGPLDLPGASGRPQARRSSATGGGVLADLRPGPAGVLRVGRDELDRLAHSDDPRLRAQAELAAGLGTVDALVLGTSARGVLNGVLAVGRTSVPFEPETLALLDLVALQVGLALDAARLLEAQRSVSAAMQRSLLPPLPQVAGLEIAARYQTATQGLDVGGDWYDAFGLVDGGLAVVIGDATGHDTAAAASMAGLRNQLRALAVDRGELPAATLARLDRTGSRLGHSASATCLYARLDAGPGGGWSLRWSSAGHLPPVLVRGGTATVEATAPDLMLGVDPDSARADHEAQLQPGDLLLLCTDGLVEDRRTPIDDRLETLRGLVAEHAGAHPEQLADDLLAALAHDSDDDVAVLVVRVGLPS